MPHLQEILRELSIIAFPLLLAVTLHEVAHGYVANWLGDPTARLAGRLTLNPLAHLDVTGTLVFVLTRMIGWAKPVPVDARYFRNPRRDMIWVSLAGPATNFLLAVALALCYRLLSNLPLQYGSPVGARVLFPLMLMAHAGVLLNLGLGLFNLLPVPPLDGSRILAGVLPVSAFRSFHQLERFGFLILLLVIFSGVLDVTIYPVLRFTATVLLGA